MRFNMALGNFLLLKNAKGAHVLFSVLILSKAAVFACSRVADVSTNRRLVASIPRSPSAGVNSLWNTMTNLLKALKVRDDGRPARLKQLHADDGCDGRNGAGT